MGILVLWRWELVIVTYTWASEGGARGKNQISPIFTFPWKKSFRRPCAYSVWNKTPESIFQIARGKWGTQ